MPLDVVFPGAHYDDGKALAMAEALLATLAQARLADVTAVDQLAALGIAAARVILESKLRAVPDTAAQNLAAFVAAVARVIPPAGPLG